jgi:hypothetical protein
MMTKPDYYKLSEVPTPNYDAWEFRTRISAKSKGLLDTIFGDDTEPSTGHNSKGWKAWKARQDSAAELIVKSLGDDQLVHVRGLEDDPKLMWERLRTVHEKTGTGSALGLWKSFHNLMYTDFSVPLRTHIGILRAYAEQLDRLHKDKPSDTQIISRILSSLPSSYSTIIKILDSHPIGTNVDYVVERLLTEESSQKDEHNQLVASDTTRALYASRRSARSSLVCENPVCKTAGRTGHLKGDCFWPGGGKEGQWPEWWEKIKKGGESTVPLTVPASFSASFTSSGDIVPGNNYAL